MRKPRLLPHSPDVRLPTSAAPKFFKRSGRVNHRSIKCGLCGKKRAHCVYDVFQKRMQVWTCYDCLWDFLPWFDLEQAIEKILMERFAQNPAFSLSEKKQKLQRKSLESSSK